MKRLFYFACLGLFFGALQAHAETRQVYCESRSSDYNTCNVDGRIDYVELRRQVSDADCDFGSDWGYTSNHIWVDNGCRAFFTVTLEDRHPFVEYIRCESMHDRYKACEFRYNNPRRVTFLRQISNRNCYEGRNWGVTRNYIWVDDGCRADFEVRY